MQTSQKYSINWQTCNDKTKSQIKMHPLISIKFKISIQILQITFLDIRHLRIINTVVLSHKKVIIQR
jgi:hypothetical protein